LAVRRTVPANLVHRSEKAVKVFVSRALVFGPAAAFANTVCYGGSATLVLDPAAGIGFDRLGEGRAMAHSGAVAPRPVPTAAGHVECHLYDLDQGRERAAS
jgi:hypothetical protein